MTAKPLATEVAVPLAPGIPRPKNAGPSNVGAPTIEKETVASNREIESSQSVWAAPLPYTILAKNAAVGLSVLIGVAIVLEYLLRRREALKS